MGNSLARRLSAREIQAGGRALAGCQGCGKGTPAVRLATVERPKRWDGPIAQIVCRVRPDGIIGRWLGCYTPKKKTTPPGGGGQTIPSLQDTGNGFVQVQVGISFTDALCQGSPSTLPNCTDTVCNASWQVTAEGQIVLGVYDQNGHPLAGYYVYAAQTPTGVTVTPDPSSATDAQGEAVTGSDGTITFNIGLSEITNPPTNGYPATSSGFDSCACASGNRIGDSSTQTIGYRLTGLLFELNQSPDQTVLYTVGVLEKVSCTVGYALCNGKQGEGVPCDATGCDCGVPSNA